MSDTTTAAPVYESVLDQLHTFAERYHLTASRQQQILEDYLFVRGMQRTEDAGPMGFTEFLDLYAAWADKEARGWPSTGLKAFCADAKVWPVKNRVALLAGLADGLIAADQAGQSCQITLYEFIGNLAQAVANGQYHLPKLAAKKRSKKVASAVSRGLVFADGMRCLFTTGDLRDHTGTLQKAFGDSWQFLTDEGELLQDISLVGCKEPGDDFPDPPEMSYSAAQELVFPEASDWTAKMAIKTPLADLSIGDVVDHRAITLGPVRFELNIRNGELGLYVDANLVDVETNAVVHSAPPREYSVLGYYRLKYDNAWYKIEVVTEAQEAPTHAQGETE